MAKGILVVPDWERRRDLSNPPYDIVENLPLIHEKKFVIGRARPLMKRGFNNYLGIKELSEKYGGRAIKKAKKIGEEIGANIAFLYSIRGFNQLEITAHYFKI